ncbi:hypothetical protein GGI42DRAFT_141913 [Trichoderma sp. SZMC 28013]
MLPRDSIYCEAVFPPQDIYYEGSEDEDYDDAEARRLRYEAAGRQFLAGRVPMLLSATLKGPFDEESGWVNPWRSKNRTANSQRRPESQPVGSQYSFRRPAASASTSPVAQRQAIEVLKNAECALPSPESLKQAPFTEPRPRLRGKVAGLYGWEEDDASLSPTKDGYDSWAASSPSHKLSKRKSKSSIGADSTSKKRRRVESSEIEIKTPTSQRRRAITTSPGEQRTRALSNTSIYSHIRELTSKIPRQDLSSEEGDTFDSDDDETLITHPSADASSTNMRNPSSSLSSPFSQPSLLRALSPVSISPAQTPSKQRFPATQSPSKSPGKSPSRPRSSSGLSCLLEAPTNLSDLSDLEALGAGDHVDDEAHAHNNATAPESHSSEEELERSPLEFNEWASASATQSLPRATTPISANYVEPTSSSDDASRALVNGLEANYKVSHGFIMSFGATTPTRMAHPIIYNDADGSDDLAPDSSITALSSAQQPAANRTEAANVSRDTSGNGSPTKTNSPTKSSALQSLSPRNGRINSRPAPNKIAQPHHSSPIKSPAAVDKAIYFQEEDSQQSKENVESKEAKENPLPQVMRTNIPMSQPGLSEIAPDLTCKADHSKVDKSQEEPVARDTATLSTASLSSQLPIETAPPTEMDNTAQLNVLPNTPELAEPSLAQEGVSADSQYSVPIGEDAGPDMFGAHTSEKAADPESTAVLADDHGQTPLQEQENPTLTPTKASESLVIPPQNVITEQPSSEDLPLPTETVPERPSTPEPRFAFTSFSSFMSPSPIHRRQTRFFTGGTYNNVASTSHGILVSSKNRAWRSTTAKKRVSWAPLPHEETDGSGEKISSETDTSSSLSRGRDRAVSPPPPPSTSLASDSLTDRDMKFSHHFAAVADRSKGTQPQSVPTASGHGSCSPDRQAPVTAVHIASPARINDPSKLNLHRGEKGVAKVTSSGWDDDNDPTDIVQDIFNEMDDFLQVWDVDAELDEARKAEKVQAAAGKKKKAETCSDMDMDMGMDMDMSAQFF